MSLVLYIRGGLSTIRRRFGIVFFLYGIQLIVALILILPLRHQIENVLGNSLMGKELLLGQGASFLFEWLAHQVQSDAILYFLLIILGMLYLLMSLFFQGGIFESFKCDSKRFPLSDFIHASALFFGRFFRLFMIFLFWSSVAFLFYAFLGIVFKPITGDSESLQVILFIVRGALLLVILHIIQMVFDYSKIATVAANRKDMWKTALRSWQFVFSHFRNTVLLYVFYAITGLAFFILFWQLERLIPISLTTGIIFLFIFQQAYTIGIGFLCLTIIASETVLFRNITQI